MKLTLRRPHALDPVTLRARITERVKYYDQRYPHFEITKHYHWLDDTHARAAYRGGSGNVKILPDEIVVELELPFFARLYRGKIEEFVLHEMDAVTSSGTTSPTASAGS